MPSPATTMSFAPPSVANLQHRHYSTTVTIFGHQQINFHLNPVTFKTWLMWLQDFTWALPSPDRLPSPRTQESREGIRLPLSDTIRTPFTPSSHGPNPTFVSLLPFPSLPHPKHIQNLISLSRKC